MIAPANALCGHIENRCRLPHPYSMRCLLGQFVEVRDDQDNVYLISETEDHWLLHRRITPQAHGHERNRVEFGPVIGIPKNG